MNASVVFQMERVVGTALIITVKRLMIYQVKFVTCFILNYT